MLVPMRTSLGPLSLALFPLLCKLVICDRFRPHHVPRRYRCAATSLSVVWSFDVHSRGRVSSSAIPPPPNPSMLLTCDSSQFIISHCIPYQQTAHVRTFEFLFSLSSSDRFPRVAIVIATFFQYLHHYFRIALAGGFLLLYASFMACDICI